MQLPGPFDIRRVLEFEGAFREPQFLLPDSDHDSIMATQAGRDSRVYDAENRKFVMAFHSLIVRTGRANILVDSCVGNHKDRPTLPEWHMRDGPFLQEMVSAAGIGPDEVDFVLCTHLHADHVGWNTKLENGQWVPTFPNARYLFAKTEVEHWQAHHNANPEDRGRRSWEDSVLPVLEAGLVDQVSTDHELEAGVYLSHAPGHTPGNIILNVEQGDQKARLVGDTIHHAAQIARPDWSSAFCSDPVQSAVTRRAVVEKFADTGDWVMPAHFPTPTAVRIESAPDMFRYKFVGD